MSRNSKLAEALRKNRERSSTQFLPFFKFPQGKTIIRILPASAQDTPDDWFLPVGYHYNVDDKRPLTCRWETQWAEEACPICDMVREFRSDGMNDEANKIGLRRQFVVRAIVRGEEEKAAQMVRLPSTLFQAIGEIIRDDDTFGDVLHPGPKGRDIIVVKTGQNLQTEYQANAHPKNLPALPTPDATKALIAAFPAIADLVVVPTKEEIEAVVKTKFGYVSAMGDVYDDTDDDDDDDDASDDSSWGVGDDVPFGGGTETDADTDDDDDADSGVVDADDDAWMAPTAGDDEDKTPSVSELARADQEKSLKAGLKKELGDDHEVEEKKPPKKKKAKSRTKKPAA